ncbi:MAG: ribosome maturation factor RimM [Candidatus Binatia bacterium]
MIDPTAKTSRNRADAGRLISIGEITGAHGVRGELRMRSFNPASSVLAEIRDAFLVGVERDPKRVRLLRARPHGSVWLLVIDGIETPEAVRHVVGREVAIPEAELPSLRAGEFYQYQLIGLAVVDESGATFGTVANVLSASGNEVLVVDDGSRERLIPLVDRLVREIDLGAKRIVVRPIDGLLD